MDTPKRLSPLSKNYIHRSRCLFCGYEREQDVCLNCVGMGNKVFNRQVAFSKRQPHAVDRRQVEKQ